MSEIPGHLKYTRSHEWVRVVDDELITVGITDHAQTTLGDMVFVETPKIGAEPEAEEACAVVESVKAAADIYCPVGGEIVETNAKLADSPELVNEQPYEDGWIFQVRVADMDELENLLSAEDYGALCEDEEY